LSPPVSGETPAASTKIVKVSASSLTVTGKASGDCWTSSIASPRSDAFRCSAGNTIYDPCFVRDRNSVVCATDVFSSNGTQLELTKPLPAAASPGPPRAWAMLLQSGAKCNAGTGTVVEGYPYYCSGKDGVCQEPDLSKQQQAYFVKCGTATDALHVKSSGSTLVKILYE
ncbi:MAG: hypothetical protein JO199_02480, partial [Candidatus Eremiobacteraeota bacterium]|nr:hypothetical protein [Candidatus Eremiobacteraeota bacterium]